MISFRDVCFTLTAVNFIAFWIAAFLLGGDAVNGHSGGGHYFLCAHRSCHEVSKAVFAYSYCHAMSVIVTFFALIVASVCEKRFASKIQIETDESIQEKYWRPRTILRIVNAAFWVTS